MRLLSSSASRSLSPAPLPVCGAAAAARAAAATRDVLDLISGFLLVDVVLHGIRPMQGVVSAALSVFLVERAGAGRQLWKGVGLVDGDGVALHMLIGVGGDEVDYGVPICGVVWHAAIHRSSVALRFVSPGVSHLS